MISKRGFAAALAGGAGVVLLSTTSAFACSIKNFEVDSNVACSNGQAVITVTDTESASATISLVPAAGNTATAPASQTLSGGTATFDVPWSAGASWTVHADVPQYNFSEDIKTVTVPKQDCAAAPTPTDTPTASATPSAPASAPASTVPVAATSAPAAAPSASASSAPATLAETGGGNSSGLIAAAAGALVVVGGGALFMARRKARGNA